MALIEKRGKRWRVLIRRKGFPSESATFFLKAEADAWARSRDSELTGVRHGVMPRRTVRQAIERYKLERCPQHRGARWEVIRLDKILRTVDFADRELRIVSPSDIQAWVDNLSTASSSRRREYGLLRAVFAAAVLPWRWLKESPFAGLKPPTEGRPRKRRVSDEEADAIISALGYARGLRPMYTSQFVAAAFLFSIETAMRQGEILSATRDQVRGRTLHLERTKNGDERDVPLSRAALSILELLPESGFLFPVTPASADALFRKARKKAGIADLHFHDARREATTRMAKKLDVMQLSKVTGHKDVRTLMRVYYSPDTEEIAARLD